MPSLDATLRHRAILEVLQSRGNVKVTDLSEELSVSPVTVRADLEYLEQQKALRRTRGGAMPIAPRRFELPIEVTAARNQTEKRAIGRMAAGLVQNGDTIIVDVGGTTTELAKALSPELRDVVVVTNALNIALELEHHPGITVVVTGGTLRPLQHSLVAPLGAVLLKQVNADISFVGCSGVDPVKGFTNANLAEAEIKQAIMDAATKKVVLADHSKLLEIATARICDLADVDLLITDSGASDKQLSTLRQTGLSIEIADVPEM